MSTVKALTVTIDGIELTIPAGYGQHCWEFRIEYSCGHPVTEVSCEHLRKKVITIRRNNHRGPCWIRGCILAKQTHGIPEKCHRCELWDINFEGIHP
ncbi:hypothetical protein F5Y04DRAFT_259291 [Hypomontagnella monticulosa]|nr:hypothetical protein F5Y04DRAFT_259291 [Hypomontagnella monticulosa]